MPRNSPSSQQSWPALRAGVAGRLQCGRLQWLVSVRDLAEAKQVDPFGVDILDLKEPLLGPLSPVTVDIWQELGRWDRRQSADRRHRPLLSAALGEPKQAISIAGHLPPEFAFAKVGPSGCQSVAEIAAVWDATRAQLTRSTELVAVAYADHQAAASLPAEQILVAAIRKGFRRILLDTFEKNGQSAIDVLGTARLIEFGRIVGRDQLWWSLAGSITIGHVNEINQYFPDAETAPDCVAVRGDICDGSRVGTLSSERMQAWKQALQA